MMTIKEALRIVYDLAADHTTQMLYTDEEVGEAKDVIWMLLLEQPNDEGQR